MMLLNCFVKLSNNYSSLKIAPFCRSLDVCHISKVTFCINHPPSEEKKILKKEFRPNVLKNEDVPDFGRELTVKEQLDKLARSIQHDFWQVLHFLKNPFWNRMNRGVGYPVEVDVLIVGGGPIGSAIAYYLKERARSHAKILVVDKDISKNHEWLNSLEYAEAMMLMSMSGLTQQLSVRESIQLALFGAEFIRNAKYDLKIPNGPENKVSFFPFGHLKLASKDGVETLKENFIAQQYLGAKSEVLTSFQLGQRYPWLNISDVEMGCHGLQNEGWFDVWGFTHALRAKAIALGVDYVDGEVVKFLFENNDSLVVEGYGPGEYEGVNDAVIKLANGDIKKTRFFMCVIAAGPFTGSIFSDLLHINENGEGYKSLKVPIEPRRRVAYRFTAPHGPGIGTPLVVDPSGIYVRRDGVTDSYICGKIPPIEVEQEVDESMSDREYFDQHIWPILAYRIPAFESIKYESSFSTYVDYNTFDQNGIFGPHPAYTNIFIASGFGNRAAMFAPGIGRAFSEYIIEQRYMNIDMRPFHFDRIVVQNPLYEAIIT